MALSLPPLPLELKSIQHYLKTASEHDKRDPVIAYWCRVYALQLGIPLNKSTECKVVLISLMDHLEKTKRDLSDNEAISSDVVAQAHIENYALKLFVFADNEDRSGRANKNLVKTFYTAGMLFDVLTTFGELTDEVVKHRKYAKWKAAYIHNCLKNGEIPIPGPIGGEDADGWGDAFNPGLNQQYSFDYPQIQEPQNFQAGQSFPQPHIPPYIMPSTSSAGIPPPGMHAPPTTPSEMSQPSRPSAGTTSDWNPNSNPDGFQLQPEDFTKAQKYCKYAGSALQYEDVPTAIDNLQKALQLLTTGRNS